MDPVTRNDHNTIYRGEHENEAGVTVNEGVGDLSCRRVESGLIVGHWRPSPEELVILNAGGDVEVAVWQEPIPPLSVKAVPADDDNQNGKGRDA